MEVTVDLRERSEPVTLSKCLQSKERNESGGCAIFLNLLCVALVISLGSVVAVGVKKGPVSQDIVRRSAISIETTSVRQSVPTKDRCLTFFSRHERAECLQPLLEAYPDYSDTVTLHCPNLALLIGGEKCRDCPWDSVDPSSNLSLVGDLFHKAGKSCRVADHVRIYAAKAAKVEVYKTHYRASMAVSLIIAILSVIGVVSAKQMTVLGHRVPEAMYLGLCWFTFNWCAILWARTQDYYIYCQSLSARFTDQTTRYIAYGTVLYVSFSRCLKLPSKAGGKRASPNWSDFVRDVFANWKLKSGEDRILASVVLGLSSFLFLVFIVPLFFHYDVGSRKATSLCLAEDIDSSMGSIQLSKLILQTFSVIFYALGPQRSRCGRNLRFFVLAFIILISLFVLTMTFTSLYTPYGLSALFPRALDFQIAFDFTEVVHAIVVSLLGLLEPWRSNPTGDTDETVRSSTVPQSGAGRSEE